MKARSHGLTWRSRPLTIILHLLTPVGPFSDYDFSAVPRRTSDGATTVSAPSTSMDQGACADGLDWIV